MRARWILNLGLLLVLAGLGAGIWWTRAERARVSPFAGVSADQVNRIVANSARGPSLVLERQGGGWRIAQPMRAPASPLYVDQLLRLLTGPAYRHFTGNRPDPESSGLASPKLRIRFAGRTLAVGRIEPLSRRRYVALGDQIYLVTDGVTPVVRSGWWNFIDRRLLAGETASLAAITVGDARVVREPGAGWRKEAGQLPEPAGDFARRWQQAAATLVKPWEGATPDGTAVTLTLSDGGRRNLLAVSEPHDRLLIDTDRGLAYSFGNADWSKLLARMPD